MAFLGLRVLLVLSCSNIAEIMCGKIKLDGAEDNFEETDLVTTAIIVSSAKTPRVLAKRDLPAPTVAYYDFLVNEFSFKVWAVFEVVTIALLFYSTFAAIYYARWTYLRTDPTDDDLSLLRRAHERFIRALDYPPGRELR